MVWELVAELLSKFESIWPVKAGRCAQHLANLLHLVLLALPGEEWPHREELSHDAAHREYVNGCVVVRVSEQNFRRSVPSRAHVVREGRSSINLLCKPNSKKLSTSTTLIFPRSRKLRTWGW